jgi:hypothetical protein
MASHTEDHAGDRQSSPEDVIRGVGALLADASQPICSRFRSIFTLSNLGGHLAIEALIGGMCAPCHH